MGHILKALRLLQNTTPWNGWDKFLPPGLFGPSANDSFVPPHLRRRVGSSASTTSGFQATRMATSQFNASAGVTTIHLGPTTAAGVSSIKRTRSAADDDVFAESFTLSTILQEQSGCAGLWINDRMGESITWTDSAIWSPHPITWAWHSAVHGHSAAPAYYPGERATLHLTDCHTYAKNNGPFPVNLTIWKMEPRKEFMTVPPSVSTEAVSGIINIGLFTDIVSGWHRQSFGSTALPTMYGNGRGIMPGVTTPETPIDNTISHYECSPYDSQLITQHFSIKPALDLWIRPGDQLNLRYNTRRPFNFDPMEWNLPLGQTDETKTSWQREYIYAKEFGPVYFFRLRGSPVHDESKRTPGVVTDDVNQGPCQLDWYQSFRNYYSGDTYNTTFMQRDRRVTTMDLSTTKDIDLANAAAQGLALNAPELTGNDV